ncbi:MAG: monovalent cation/H(+) antiporter subunit G [Chlorobi bacterium]|nr:monovalent cation/H(+) antiporter subunit G [Chlorobiota bacterium]
MTIYQTIGGILILIGAVFLFLGGLGIYRMPDIYNRLQAGTKATTLGAMSLILGVGVVKMEDDWTWMVKMAIIVIFIAFSNPISSHALARAMYHRKKYPYIKDNKEGMDAYRKVMEKEEERKKKK